MQTFYATKRHYADIEENGTTIRTLVAVPGKRISPHLAHLVPDDAKTTEKPRREQLLERATVASPTIAAGATSIAPQQPSARADTEATSDDAALGELREKLEAAEARARESEEQRAAAERDRASAEEGRTAADEARAKAESALAEAEQAAASRGDVAAKLAEELKGDVLEGVLEAAELPKDGRVDEKRKRIVDHLVGEQG